MEAIWYLGPLSLCCPSESCPTFSPGSVWHLSFTRVTTPPNPALPLSFFIVYCSRLRDSALLSKLCNSVISTSTILACTADKQPNTEMMNTSQTTRPQLLTPGGGLFICFTLVILEHSASNLVYSFTQLAWAQTRDSAHSIRRTWSLGLALPPLWTFLRGRGLYFPWPSSFAIAFSNFICTNGRYVARRRFAYCGVCVCVCVKNSG